MLWIIGNDPKNPMIEGVVIYLRICFHPQRIVHVCDSMCVVYLLGDGFKHVLMFTPT